MRRPSSVLPSLLLAAGLLAGCSSTPESPQIADEDLGASAAPVEDEPTTAPSPTTPAEDAPADEESVEPATDDEPVEPDTADAAPTRAEVCDGREDEAFIAVLSPVAGAAVTSPFTVTGCGNTFEANYVWRLEQADGTVLADGFGTMTCGNGCVGDFELEVTAEGSGDVTLVLFEESAEDGEPTNVVEVALTLG